MALKNLCKTVSQRAVVPVKLVEYSRFVQRQLGIVILDWAEIVLFEQMSYDIVLMN